MIERSLSCLGPHGFYRMAYVEWGRPEGRTIVCVHGLTRNGRDFDALAAALAGDARVICPDMPGRGKSEFLTHAEDYTYPTYLGAVATLLARLGVDEVDWVGTSMGGIIGMLLAALPGTPIRRLVLNDVGAVIAAEGLNRLAYLCRPRSELCRQSRARGGAAPDRRTVRAAVGRGHGIISPDTARASAKTARWGWAYDAAHRRRLPPGRTAATSISGPNGMRSRRRRSSCAALESDILRHEDAVAMTARGPARAPRRAAGHRPCAGAGDAGPDRARARVSARLTTCPGHAYLAPDGFRRAVAGGARRRGRRNPWPPRARR